MDISKETILDLTKMNVYAQRAQLGELLLNLLSSSGGDEVTGDASIIQADTYLNFPNIGNKNNLYIDTSKNTIYRWDEKKFKYFMVGSNVDYAIDTLVDELEFINGGNANGN